MAIKITEDGVVIYENEPDVERELFPNIPEGGGSPVEDGSITRAKLDSDLNSYLDSMGTDIGELKENFNDLGLSVVDGAINITYEEATV